ncbi:MAG: phosphoribosyltransferase [Microcystaceae cyanobacterium]
MTDKFKNRQDAGQKLAQKLLSYQNISQGLILALPRGGVPVAFEIAQTLQLPLDVCLVRKLGVPSQPELAMGAIALEGISIINQPVVEWLNITEQTLEEVVKKEKQELNRRNLCYRGHRPFPNLYNSSIILVDDGIATGSTIKAAITAIKHHDPQKIVVAVPLAPPTVINELVIEVEQMTCLLQPDPLHSISVWYEDFGQTSDQEVCYFLEKAQQISAN